MKEFEETKPIRDMLEAFEPQAPEFNLLFEGEILGDASFRQIFQSKLDTYEAESPSFNQIFADKPLGQTLVPHKHLIPMWAVISAAAACFTLLMLLPEKIQMDQGALSLVEHKVIHKTRSKGKPLFHDSTQINLITEKLESPNAIGAIAIEKKKLQTRETLISYEEAQRERDSSSNQNIRKISPSSSNYLAVANKRSVEQAYKDAKVKKEKIKRDRMVLGTHFNSANRLLSLVNTKSTGTYPLEATANQYSTGYSNLEGSSTSMLRTATVSRNAWVTPENIPASVSLSAQQAVYSLPINIGLSVSFPLFRDFEIITGLNYTYLHSTTNSNSPNYSCELKQGLHYIGIPVKLSLNLIKRGRFGTYAALGGTIEKGLVGTQKCYVTNTNGEESDWENNQKIYGFQPSLTGQLGLYYELNRTFNLYLEPGVSYFIPNDQPVSSRTDEPYNFNLGFGLRYRIK